MARLSRRTCCLIGGLTLAASPLAASAAQATPLSNRPGEAAASLAPAIQSGGAVAAVAPISADNAYAVGKFDGTKAVRLIAHWNGTSWRPVGPTTAQLPNTSLYAISADGPNDVWAVGDNVYTSKPVVMQWNGKRWLQVPGEAPLPSGGNLDAVSAVSSDDVWISGGRWSRAQRADLEHWDGTSWTRTQLQDVLPNLIGESIRTIDALSATDVWALGYGTLPGHAKREELFTLHLVDGKWQFKRLPVGWLQFGTGYFEMSAQSDSDIWVAGYQDDTALHFNGLHWKPVTTGTPPGEYDNVSTVTAIAPDDVWAMGDASVGPFAEHWDGSSWTDATVPRGEAGDLIWSSSGSASNDVWLTGTTAGGAGLGWHWNGTAWKSIRV